jgi:probable rRNA maturation factor
MAINNMSSGRQHQNIVVQVVKDFENIEVSLPKLKNLVRAICSRFGLLEVTVSIAIVDDAQIRKINKQFLNRNCTSDCLSFDLSDSPAPIEHSGAAGLGAPKSSRLGGAIGAGLPGIFELVVNGERAVREGRLRGHSGETELALYVTHGLLHNVGFDDSTKEKAKKMHNAEDEILQRLGYGAVYNKGVKSTVNRKSQIANLKSR